MAVSIEIRDGREGQVEVVVAVADGNLDSGAYLLAAQLINSITSFCPQAEVRGQWRECYSGVCG